MILVVKHVVSEDAGLIGDLLRERGCKASTVELEKGDSLPASLSPFNAVVFMGGPMGVYDEERYPFLIEEDKLIKEAVSNGIPFLGVCLGAQLLAKACGARVHSAACSEIGYFDISITPEGKGDPIFSGVPPSIKVFQWHNDTFDIPAGGVLLATAEECRNQAFKIGKNAYGLQFHIESTPEMVSLWLNEDLSNPDPTIKERAEKIISEADKVYNAMLSYYKLIIENFLSIACK